MRDIFLVLFFFVIIYYTFRRPFIGVCAWIWIALTAPTNWAFGFSNELRLNLSIVLITFFAYLFSQKNKTFQLGLIGWLVLLFCFWTLITSTAHITYESTKVWGHFNDFVKVVALFFFMVLILKNQLHINTLIWCIILSVSSYAALEGVKFLLSGGGHSVIGRAGVIRDRNDFAVAINMCIPLIVYLLYITKMYYLKLGLIFLLLLNIVAVIGTGSRGGFIGLTILAIAFWWKSKRKILWLLVAMAIIPVAYQFTPEDWRERQSTIQTAAVEDGSFIGRLWAWKISTMIANDNPITGGGFRAVLDPVVWNSYSPLTPNYGPVTTPDIPEGASPKAAHSIYFQVLGDHGYIGFFLFMSILLIAFFTNVKNKSLANVHKQLWLIELSKALNLSIIGYVVTGANVSLAYFDLLYAVIGIIVIIKINKLHLSKGKLVLTAT